jgi:hypothetical protein
MPTGVPTFPARPGRISNRKSAIYESVGGVKRKRDLHLGRDAEGYQGRPEGVHLDP